MMPVAESVPGSVDGYREGRRGPWRPGSGLAIWVRGAGRCSLRTVAGRRLTTETSVTARPVITADPTRAGKQAKPGSVDRGTGLVSVRGEG